MTNSTNITEFSIHLQWTDYFSLICGILLVFICLFGLITNLLSTIVFLQPHFRRLSVNILLATVSVAYFLLLCLALPTFGVRLILEFFLKDNIYYEIISWFYPLVLIFHCISIWLLILITFERWIAVCKPLHIGKCCTRRRALVSVAFVVGFSFGLNMGCYWMRYCGRPSLLVWPGHYYYISWHLTIINLIIIHILPFSLLLLFNYLVLSEMLRTSRSRHHMTSTERIDYRTARMMMAVVIAFVCCYTLSFVLNLVESLELSIISDQLRHAMTQINNILVLSNAASSVLFYVKFSRRYRMALEMIIARIFCPYLYQRMVIASAHNMYISLFSKQETAISRRSSARLSYASVFSRSSFDTPRLSLASSMLYAPRLSGSSISTTHSASTHSSHTNRVSNDSGMSEFSSILRTRCFTVSPTSSPSVQSENISPTRPIPKLIKSKSGLNHSAAAAVASRRKSLRTQTMTKTVTGRKFSKAAQSYVLDWLQKDEFAKPSRNRDTEMDVLESIDHTKRRFSERIILDPVLTEEPEPESEIE